MKINFNFSKPGREPVSQAHPQAEPQAQAQVQPPPRVPASCAPGMEKYTVKPGDTMSSLARKFSVSLSNLIANNPHIPDPNFIYPGDVLCVPGIVPRVPASCPMCYNRYTVKPGDTMEKIALNLGVLLDLLLANNDHIPDPSVIYPGDVLCVPQPLPLPFCSTLGPSIQLPLPDVTGVALAASAPGGQHELAVMGIHLPKPSDLGPFDFYQGFLGIPGIGGFGFFLGEVPQQPGVWAGSVRLRPLLTVGNQLYVVPGNTQTGEEGKPVLAGLLGTC